jgi:hypothetical protein
MTFLIRPGMYPNSFDDSPTSGTSYARSFLARVAATQASHQANPFQAEVYRDFFISSFRTWLDDDNRPKQREFWRLFDGLQSSRIALLDLLSETAFQQRKDVEPNYFTERNIEAGKTCSLAHLSPSIASNSLIVEGCTEAASLSTEWVLFHQSFIVDGQHRLQAFFRRDFSRYVSAKATKRALEAALRELSAFDNGTITDLIRLVGSTLSREISGAIKLVVRVRTSRSVRLKGDQTTRDRVLNFSIHTGNPPPPALSRSRSVVGRALVTLSTNARREDYATIQRQEVSRNLRNTNREQRARARFNCGTQSHANYGGGWQPSGYRYPRPHHSLARCA